MCNLPTHTDNHKVQQINKAEADDQDFFLLAQSKQKNMTTQPHRAILWMQRGKSGMNI